MVASIGCSQEPFHSNCFHAWVTSTIKCMYRRIAIDTHSQKAPFSFRIIHRRRSEQLWAQKRSRRSGSNRRQRANETRPCDTRSTWLIDAIAGFRRRSRTKNRRAINSILMRRRATDGRPRRCASDVPVRAGSGKTPRPGPGAGSLSAHRPATSSSASQSTVHVLLVVWVATSRTLSLKMMLLFWTSVL